MQHLIDELQHILNGNMGWVAGLALLVVLGLYAAIVLLRALSRISFERRLAAQERERLALAIELAKVQIREARQENGPWNGIRKFKVARKIAECEGVVSFYLEPHDGKAPLPLYKPGQYLTFQLNV